LLARTHRVVSSQLWMVPREHRGHKASRAICRLCPNPHEDGGARKQGLILRRDPVDSLIDTDRKVEFAAIRSMEGVDIPVPKALFLEEDGAPLGAPFFVMERRHPPPPAQKLSIVHGDYRIGNFLHDEKGNITAVLDWEMAHIGDPYEDFAWCTDLLWSGGDVARAAGMLPWPDAVAEWEVASDLKFDFGAFEWWSIFSSVKAIGIWISSARAFADGANDDPVLAFSGWFTHAAHERILAARLSSKYKV